MTLRFCSLASGSRGNAVLVEYAETLLLIDCGVTMQTLEERMQAVGRTPEQISAVLITHEHGDHVSGLAPLLRRVACPLWSTHGTAKGTAKVLRDVRDHNYNEVRFGQKFRIGDIDVWPYPVPHDAREPSHFRFSADARTLGVLTDAGHITQHVASALSNVDALAVEFNHDLDSLQAGPYPHKLKKRVASRYGHLNNVQAAELVEGLDHERLRWVVALHISQQNNSAEHVDASMAQLRERAGFEFWHATQGTPTGWFEVS